MFGCTVVPQSKVVEYSESVLSIYLPFIHEMVKFNEQVTDLPKNNKNCKVGPLFQFFYLYL